MSKRGPDQRSLDRRGFSQRGPDRPRYFPKKGFKEQHIACAAKLAWHLQRCVDRGVTRRLTNNGAKMIVNVNLWFTIGGYTKNKTLVNKLERPILKRPISKRPISKRPISKKPISKRRSSKSRCLKRGESKKRC